MSKNASNPKELKQLDTIIDTAVQTYHLETDGYNKQDVEIAVKQKIREEIISEVYEYKKSQIVQEAKKEIEDEKKKSSFASIKQIMWEGFVLALIVGLLVNEASYLIQYLKELGNGSIPILVTVILIIVFSVIALALYIVKFTKDIIEKFIKNKKK
ncbi:MAG: hypothetical protein NC548_54750 [Lachnospiraceae bacterium]|nr:hypothetical protein [Lachnospiraceae bacterium]